MKDAEGRTPVHLGDLIAVGGGRLYTVGRW